MAVLPLFVGRWFLRQYQAEIGTEAVQQGEQLLHRFGVLKQSLLHGLFRRQAAFEQGHHLQAGAGQQGRATIAVRPVCREHAVGQVQFPAFLRVCQTDEQIQRLALGPDTIQAHAQIVEVQGRGHGPGLRVDRAGGIGGHGGRPRRSRAPLR